MSRSFPRFAVLLLLIAVSAQASWAATGIVRGTVTDENEVPLEGVQITVTSDDLSSFRQVLVTQEDGEFTLRFRSPQYTYKFLFEKAGYQAFTQEISPSSVRMSRETFVMNKAETRAVEQHGDLQSVVTGSTNAAVEAFNAGLAAQQAGDLETAKAKLQEALAADAGLGPAHVALAQVLLDLEDYEAAISEADAAVAADVSPADALRVKFQALRALGRREEAEAIAGELESAQDQVAAARVLYNDAAQAFQAGDLETALDTFQKAAELDPTLQDAHHAIATIQLNRQNYEAAAESAKKALSLGTEDVRTLRVLYDAYDALGKTDQLLEIAPRLASVDPDFGGPKLVEQAAALWNNGEAEKAVEVSKLALAIDPQLAKPHYFIGLSHLSAGENAEARASLEKFIAMAPDDPEAQSAREMLAYIE